MTSEHKSTCRHNKSKIFDDTSDEIPNLKQPKHEKKCEKGCKGDKGEKGCKGVTGSTPVRITFDVPPLVATGFTDVPLTPGAYAVTLGGLYEVELNVPFTAFNALNPNAIYNIRIFGRDLVNFTIPGSVMVLSVSSSSTDSYLISTSFLYVYPGGDIIQFLIDNSGDSLVGITILAGAQLVINRIA